MAKHKANSIDAAVGTRIRIARLEIGLSQETLAKKIFVSFQQLQKYENGSNRCSPSRLVLIAKATGKSVGYFFAEDESAKPGGDLLTKMLGTPHGVDIARAFIAIKNNDHRITVARMVAAIAG